MGGAAEGGAERPSRRIDGGSGGPRCRTGGARDRGGSLRRGFLMFKRPSVRYGRTPAPETPYQKAAQVWDERIGSARVQARNWRLIAFGNLALAAGLAAALVWQATRGTIVPWVVQVDKLGEAQVVAPASGDYRPSDAQIA